MFAVLTEILVSLRQLIQKMIMKTIRILLCLLFLTTLFSCDSDDVGNDFKYIINVDDVLDSISYEQLIDSVECIPLESSGLKVINQVEQMVVDNGLIFILDNKAVYCYNLEGKCQYILDKVGNARNEFRNISNISVFDGELFVSDIHSKKIICFNANTGEYLRNISLDIFAKRVYCNSNSFLVESFVYANDDKDMYCVFDMADQEKPKYSGVKRSEYMFLTNRDDFLSTDGMIVTSYYGAKSWKVSADGIVPYFKLVSSSDEAWTEDEVEEYVYSMLEDDVVAHKVSRLGNVAESNKYITGVFTASNSYSAFVYDKQNDKSLCFRYLSNYGRSENTPQFFPFMASDGESFYSVIDDPEEVYLSMKRGFFKKDPGMVFSETDSCKSNCWENYNPVVIRYHFKNYL